MIIRKKFDNSVNIDKRLSRDLSIYSIESIADKRLRYGLKNGVFAAMRDGDAIVCDVPDMPKVAERFRGDVKREILDIYEDIKDLRLGEVW